MPAARRLLLPLCVLALWSACSALPLSGQGSRAPSSNHSKVLIIGAGAAGYAAASRLMENNFYDLTILEAERRIGGRIHTVRFAENIVDLGAEWVHGEVGNVVYEMAEPLELLSHQNKGLSSNMAFVWSGGALADPTEIELLLNASNSIGSRRDTLDQLVNYTGSYGDWFLDLFQQRLMAMERHPPADLVDRFLGWFEKAIGFYDGSDTWFNTSAQGLVHYKECDGDLQLTWKRNGYRTVFDLLTKRYPNPAQELPVRQQVRLGSEVAAIRWAERVYGPNPYGSQPYQEPYQEPYQDPYRDMRRLEPQPEPRPESQPETRPEPEPQPEPEVQTESQPEAQTDDTQPEAQTDDSQTEAQTETQTETQTQQHNEVTEASDATTPATDTPQADDPMANHMADDPMAGYLGEAPADPRPPIVVELSNGARYTADMVIVTVSLGVLKHSADALFDPPLPQRKMNAVRNLGFGQVNKLFLYFSDPWWPSTLSGYSVLVTEDDLEQFKRKYPQYGVHGHWVQGLSGFYIDQHKPNVVLMDWIVGEPARVMERYSDYQIMMGCKHWLEMFLGHNYSIPMPYGFTRSKWWSNPHFKGSYSYRSLDSDRAGAWAAHLAEPILDRQGTPAVMFAGEATHDHYYSTVHGAIETGWREADRILNTIKSEGRFRAPYSQDRDRLR